MKGDVQKAILKRLLYNDKMRYNELWNKEFSSNLFDYHLKKLIEDGIIAKQDDFYNLTPKGTQHISYLDGKTIEQKQRPLVCTFILGIGDDGKLLMHRRRKQPFLNYVGLPGGKLEMGDKVQEQAEQEFLEETGFTAKKMTMKLIANYITYDNDLVAHQMIAFFFLAEGLHGELTADNREGENFFIAEKDLDDQTLFPDMRTIIHDLTHNKSVVFKEAKRNMKNGEFLSIDFLD